MGAKIFARLESVTAPLWQWCAGFIGIIFIRFFFENFSSPTPSFPATPDAATMVHYSLFFIGIFISFALILRIFVSDIGNVTKFLFFAFPIIWLPPIIDLIVSRGVGYRIAYLFPATMQPSSLLRAFLALGSPSPFGGVTPGIHAELVAILIGAALYVYLKTRKVFSAGAAAAMIYLAWFFWFAFPTLIVAIPHFFTGLPTTISPLSSITSSFLSSHLLQNSLRPNALPTYPYAVETAFNKGMSAILCLVDFLLIAGWALLRNPALVRAVSRNLRPARAAYYLGMVAVGTIAVARNAAAPIIANWVDGAYFAVLMLTYLCAWLFAVSTNDLADIAIDTVSNAARPLPSHAVRETDLSDAAFFFLAWLLIGGFVCGYWATFTVLTFTAAYYIYSARPLRLKRIPLLSSFLISVATLSALMAGFYFADPGKTVSDFPARIILLVIVCITLAANFKDIKDVAGDRMDGIATIPVIFGEERGKQIAGTLLAAAFLLVPAILKNWALFLPSLAAASFGYGFCVTKHYKEWRVFAVYFIYLGVVCALLWG